MAPVIYGNSLYWRSIKANAADIPSNETNVPWGVKLTVTGATRTDGYDIVVTDVHGNLIPREIAKFDDGTGELQLWYRDPAQNSLTGGTEVFLQWGGTVNIPNDPNVWRNNWGGTENHVIVYHGEDSSGDAIDSSGYNNDGQATGITYEATGKINNAHGYGVGDRIVSPSPTNSDFGTGDWSISCWFRTPNVGRAYNFIFNGGYPIRDDIMGLFIHNTSKLNFYSRSNALAWKNVSSNTGVLSNNTFHHVHAQRRSDGYLYMFVDGVQQTDVETGSDANFATVANRLILGAYYWGGYQEYFDGEVDEVRIARTALTANQNLAQYNNQAGFLTNSSVTLGDVTEVFNPIQVISVSVTGNDFTGDGSFISPVKSVKRALELIPAGSLIDSYEIAFLTAGDYDAFFLDFAHFQTNEGNKILFNNISLGEVNIVGTNELNSTTIIGKHVRLRNINFKSSYDDALRLINVVDLIIYNCKAPLAEKHGFHFLGQGYGITMNRCEIHDCQNGVYFDTDNSNYMEAEIKNSLIYDNTDSGIKVRDANRLLMLNNTIAFNEYGVRIGENESILDFETIVVNNTITDNSYGVFSPIEPLTYALFSHNDVYGNSVEDWVNIPDQTGIEKNISVDPLYTDKTIRDFSLQNTSPLINQATENYNNLNFLIYNDPESLTNDADKLIFGGIQPLEDFTGADRTLKLRTDIGAYANFRAERKAFVVQNTRHVIKRVDLEQLDNLLVDARYGEFHVPGIDKLNFAQSAVRVGTNVFVADIENERIIKLDDTLGGPIASVDVSGTLGKPVVLTTDDTYIYCAGIDNKLTFGKYDLSLSEVFTDVVDLPVSRPKSISMGFNANELLVCDGQQKILELTDSGASVSGVLQTITGEENSNFTSHILHSNGLVYASIGFRLVKIDDTYTNIGDSNLISRPIMIQSEINTDIAIYDLQNRKVLIYDENFAFQSTSVESTGDDVNTDYEDVTTYIEATI